ncbi:MAG: FAD-dependent oxidoreductase [Deltaproteobacteria bacterium]|nr:FAD-dependent oxidoreductase [Deltaproteobacteria bacterium]MBN2674678.1 FAD-dependent oxidoreductase [Deltaproteobacteria bacterium]
MSNAYDAIILGAGPAGLTAGIYLARARKRTLIIDEGTAGGQMILSHTIANYPGIIEATGASIARTMVKQAKSFGCEVLSQSKILQMSIEGEVKTVEVEYEGTYSAQAVIIATGGVPRSLGLASEQKYKGHGISYCATCDGEFFTDKEIVAVGGGNSALEEAVSLSRYASKVTVIHEFDHFQAQPWIVEEAKANSKIEYLMNQRIESFEGGDKLESVISTDKATGEKNTTPAEGCFVFIGYIPNTASFEGVLKLNERKEIVADENLATNIPGVFAAGDNRSKKFRQITTAVADGTVAALSAIEYIEKRKGAPA